MIRGLTSATLILAGLALLGLIYFYGELRELTACNYALARHLQFCGGQTQDALGAASGQPHRNPTATSEAAPASDQDQSGNAARALEADARRSFQSRIVDVEDSRAAVIQQLTVQAHNASMEIEALKQQLEKEQGSAADINRVLESTREQLANALQSVGDLQNENQSLEAAAKVDEDKLRDAETQRTALKSQVEQAEASAARVAVVDRQLVEEQGKSASLSGDLADARAQLAAEQGKSAALDRDLADARLQLTQLGEHRQAEAFVPSDRGIKVLQESPVDVAPLVAAAQAALPEGAVAHVTIQYARTSDIARARAMSLKTALRFIGLEVADPVAGSTDPLKNSVKFYYAEDEDHAKCIAAVTAGEPVRNRLAPKDPLPRPGTIEVTIAG